jgi:hypothetical protein
VALFALASLYGCGAYLGPNVAAQSNRPGASLGASGGYRLYPTGNESLFLDGNLSAAFPTQGAGKNLLVVGDAALGYGSLPLPHQSRLGLELGAGPSLGDITDGHGLRSFGAGWVWKLALPWRVSANRKPWELGEQVLDFSLLTPEVDIVQLFPVGRGREHQLVTAVLFSLTYRYDTWLAALP